LLVPEHLQSESVIVTSGRFLIESWLAGGVPERPRSYSDSLIMCCKIVSSLAKDLKFRFKLPKSWEPKSKGEKIKVVIGSLKKETVL
jgi:hypothetical protein